MCHRRSGFLQLPRSAVILPAVISVTAAVRNAVVALAIIMLLAAVIYSV